MGSQEDELPFSRIFERVAAENSNSVISVARLVSPSKLVDIESVPFG
jgi:hypothetical protein